MAESHETNPISERGRERSPRGDRHRRRPGRSCDRVFPGSAGSQLRDPGGGGGACGRLARAVGLAEAVHAGSLQQPAGPAVPRRSGRLPRARRRRGLPHRVRPAASPCRWCWAAASGRSGGPRAGTWSSSTDRSYTADQVVIATGPFQVPFVPPIARAARSRRLSAPQHPVPGAGGPSRWSGAGRRWRQHRLSDRRRALRHPRGSPVDRVAADAAPSADPRSRPVLVSREDRGDPQVDRHADRPPIAGQRHADRLQSPDPAQAPRRPVASAGGRSLRAHRPVQRRKRAGRRAP